MKNNPTKSTDTRITSRCENLASEIKKPKLLAILFLLFLVSGFSTYSSVAQPEYNVEIVNDWIATDAGRTNFYELINFDKIPDEYKHIWLNLSNRHDIFIGSFQARVYAIHNNIENPYVVVIRNMNGREKENVIPPIISVPKEMLSAESWEIALKAIPSEFPNKWKYTIPGPPEPKITKLGLPQDRTITDLEGRVLNVTITAIKDGKISFNRKGESRIMQFEFAKLSEADQTFIREKIDPNKRNVTGPRILIMGINIMKLTPEMRAQWENKNIQASFLTGSKPVNYQDGFVIRTDDTDITKLCEKYDGLWITSTLPGGEERTWAQFMNNLGKPVVVARDIPLTKEGYLAGEQGSEKGNVTYVKVSENFIFYNSETYKKSNRGEVDLIDHPEIIAQVADELKRIIKK